MNNQRIEIQKILPHNFLAEKMILSCLLVNFEAIEVTTQTLPTQAFYFKNHQEIYRTIIRMHQMNVPIHILSLITFLQEKALLHQIGGMKVLLELLNQIPNLIYLEDYIQLVKEKFLRRSLIKFGYKIIDSSYVTNVPLETIISQLETELFDITNQLKSQKLLTSTQLLNQMFFELKEKSLNPKLPGLPSGFQHLDLLTQGFQKSDLIIIAGRPSMGKTALSLTILLNSIKICRVPILFFSLEMSKEQIMYRLLSMESNINQTRLKNGKLYQNDWVKLNKVMKLISKLPIFIDDTPSLSVDELRFKIKNIILEQGQIGLIIIDYLQLMKTISFKNLNRVEELSQITRSLKILAREFHVPIIALSQLSRNIDNRVNQKPILSDLRESGSIEQDSDLVLMLSKSYSSKSDQEAENRSNLITELFIAKQRNGPTGNIKLRFNEMQTKFVE